MDIELLDARDRGISSHVFTKAGLSSWNTLDSSLRCPICGDFFEAPVSIDACGHIFCSLCVRRTLLHRRECPVCRRTASENNLRPIRLCEDIVQSFLEMRLEVLGILEACHFLDYSCLPSSESESINRALLSRENLIQSFRERIESHFSKFPSRCSTISSRNVMDLDPRRCNPVFSEVSPHRRSSRIQHSQKREEVLDVDFNNRNDLFFCPSVDSLSNLSDDKEFLEVSSVRSPRKNSKSSEPQSISLDSVPITRISSSSQPLKLQCPVCSLEFPEAFINSHLDTCLGRHRLQSSSSLTTRFSSIVDNFSCSVDEGNTSIEDGNEPTIISRQRERVPSLCYNIMSDKQLRRALSEWNIPAHGSRRMMIDRHREFRILYNAQLDSSCPRPVPELITEIMEREKSGSTSVQNPSRSSSRSYSLNAPKSNSLSELPQISKEKLSTPILKDSNSADSIFERLEAELHRRSLAECEVHHQTHQVGTPDCEVESLETLKFCSSAFLQDQDLPKTTVDDGERESLHEASPKKNTETCSDSDDFSEANVTILCSQISIERIMKQKEPENDKKKRLYSCLSDDDSNSGTESGIPPECEDKIHSLSAPETCTLKEIGAQTPSEVENKYEHRYASRGVRRSIRQLERYSLRTKE